MNSARIRYINDSKFKALVDQIVGVLKQEQFTPSEVREATILASIIHEEERVKPNIGVTIRHTQELENALHVIEKAREEA